MTTRIFDEPMRSLVAFCMLVAPHAFAQLVTGIEIEPDEVQAGAEVRIDIAARPYEGTVNCALRLEFGDGSRQDVHMTEGDAFPPSILHRYALSGSYVVRAKPVRIGLRLPCIGDEQRAIVTVLPALDAPASSPAAWPRCPDGWTLERASFDRASGAFACTAPAGAVLPSVRVACPRRLGYFEHLADHWRIGCAP